MSKNLIKPEELNLNQLAYFIEEELIDNVDEIARTKWYDIKTVYVKSLRLNEDGSKVVVNEGVYNQEKHPELEEYHFSIEEAELFGDKDAAIEAATDYNTKSQEEVQYSISKKKKELDEVEERRKMILNQVNKLKECNQYLEDWLNKTVDGEIYQSDPF